MLRTAYTVRLLQMLAAVLGISVVMWTTGFPGAFMHVQAAAVSDVSDTLSDSTSGALSNHTIQFETENGLNQGQTIEITFDAGFQPLPDIGPEDIDIATSTTVAGPWTDWSVQSGAAGADTWGLATSTSAITLTTPTNYGVPSSTAIQIEIGDNASFGTAGDTQITNPTATTTSYEIQIGGTMTDSGETRVAIVDTVTVSAAVDTVFDFTVSGVGSGSTLTGSPTTTVADTAANALPFGELTPNTSATLAHDLAVVTNAAEGFSVTVEQSGDLVSSTGADINSFIDGAYTDTPSEWTGPSAVIGTDTTYGHWGLSSDDSDFSGTADRWVAASTTPVTVFTHNTVADGSTTGEGTTRVGYQIQVSSLQEAGNDYTTTLTYIATPVF